MHVLIQPKSINKLLPMIAVLAGILVQPVQAALLDHKSISITGSGGLGGAGTSASDMVFSTYGSDGWGWAGGAGAVQGNLATTNNGGHTTPANETFKFNIGATVDALNTTYGAGNWTIANPTLTFASSYAVQNNSRFGIGAGNFDIYWVGNDNWAQSKGTPTDRQLNPIYASSAAELSTWSGNQALLGSENFTIAGSSYVDLSYGLTASSLFVNDILSSSASGNNQAASLYLMGTSATLGMIIFTGGQGQALPTLNFDVVSAVPLPAAAWLFGSALAGLGLFGRRKPSLASLSLPTSCSTSNVVPN
ncbi:VPLPA-CTERM sorting domain-containing protein [Methylomonas sp. MgM2]